MTKADRAVKAFPALLAVAKAARQEGCCIKGSGSCEDEELHEQVDAAISALYELAPNWEMWKP
jgi:hypothetical protein